MHLNLCNIKTNQYLTIQFVDILLNARTSRFVKMSKNIFSSFLFKHKRISKHEQIFSRCKLEYPLN